MSPKLFTFQLATTIINCNKSFPFGHNIVAREVSRRRSNFFEANFSWEANDEPSIKQKSPQDTIAHEVFDLFWRDERLRPERLLKLNVESKTGNEFNGFQLLDRFRVLVKLFIIVFDPPARGLPI